MSEKSLVVLPNELHLDKIASLYAPFGQYITGVMPIQRSSSILWRFQGIWKNEKPPSLQYI